MCLNARPSCPCDTSSSTPKEQSEEGGLAAAPSVRSGTAAAAEP